MIVDAMSSFAGVDIPVGELQQTYPLAIYESETNDSENLSAYPMVFPEPLTVDLLEKHQQISENAKVLAEEL